MNAQTHRMLRILLIDDEPGVLSALSRLLRLSHLTVGAQKWRPRVDTCASGMKAFAKATEYAYDIAVSDYRMPGMDGVKVLRRIRELQPNCARVILSGYTDLNGLVGAINEARIDRFVAKPWNDFEFISTLTQVLEIRALRMENEALADQMRCERGVMSPHELELKRLEELEPGITKVQWGPDGSLVIGLDEFRHVFSRPGG